MVAKNSSLPDSTHHKILAFLRRHEIGDQYQSPCASYAQRLCTQQEVSISFVAIRLPTSLSRTKSTSRLRFRNLTRQVHIHYIFRKPDYPVHQNCKLRVGSFAHVDSNNPKFLFELVALYSSKSTLQSIVSLRGAGGELSELQKLLVPVLA